MALYSAEGHERQFGQAEVRLPHQRSYDDRFVAHPVADTVIVLLEGVHSKFKCSHKEASNNLPRPVSPALHFERTTG